MNVNLVRIGLLGAALGTTGFLAVQPATSLSVLSPAEDRLPPGCRLEAIEPDPARAAQPGLVVVSGETGPSTPTNPWSGSDRRLAAAIRQRIDGVPREPDAPPLDRRASEAYALKSADNVVEAYRATYRSAEESLIDVFAVRFNDQTLARPTPPPGTRNLPRGVTDRVVLGESVVVISTSVDSSCFAAIRTYVRSLR